MEQCLSTAELKFFLGNYIDQKLITLKENLIQIQSGSGLVEWVYIEWANVWSFGGTLSCIGGGGIAG